MKCIINYIQQTMCTCIQSFNVLKFLRLTKIDGHDPSTAQQPLFFLVSWKEGKLNERTFQLSAFCNCSGEKLLFIADFADMQRSKQGWTVKRDPILLVTFKTASGLNMCEVLSAT